MTTPTTTRIKITNAIYIQRWLLATQIQKGTPTQMLSIPHPFAINMLLHVY